MKSTWHLIGRLRPQSRVTISIQRRAIVTFAIETSCDDTSVAILERKKNTARLHFHEKITSDNRQTQGIHPLTALESHQKSLAKLIQKSLLSLPAKGALNIKDANGVYHSKAKPDFVTVTRGPGMLSCLNTGLDTAKGLSVAWQVPLLGVNHMQAHALTPRLVSALENKGDDSLQPKFPYLTLLVSGGHTMFVHSHGIAEHEILATTGDIALGDMIDKCARDILPAEVLEAGDNVMYGRLLESFAFPDGEKANEYAYSPMVPKRD
jgi:N6-L-threonylcarbamoyladenine synthase